MRDRTIDIAKGLGIIAVVIGHIARPGGADYFPSLDCFIYQFHMPLFFFTFRSILQIGRTMGPLPLEENQTAVLPLHRSQHLFHPLRNIPVTDCRRNSDSHRYGETLHQNLPLYGRFIIRMHNLVPFYPICHIHNVQNPG